MDSPHKIQQISRLVSIIQKRQDFINNLQQKQADTIEQLNNLLESSSEQPVLRRTQSSVNQTSVPIGGCTSGLKRSMSNKEELWRQINK